MKRFNEFLNSHLSFKVFPNTWASILTALAVVPCVMFLPDRYGWENGLLENMQMAVLFLGVYFALRPKVDKKFFYFVALVLGIIILREVNCGRTLFFPIPGQENAFYSWKDIKYGYLAHPIYGLYMAFVGFYFLKNKLFVNTWEKLSKTALPIWDIILMLIGMTMGMYAEKAMHHNVFEEISELLFYVGLVGVVYLYSRDKVRKV